MTTPTLATTLTGTTPETSAMRPEDVMTLNSFLRGEQAAVETYQQAIDKMRDDGNSVSALQKCKASHAMRVSKLENRIHELGGEPSEGSGAWGGFAKLVEAGAALISSDLALSVLLEGEEHGTHNYNRDAEFLSPSMKHFVETQMLPEQRASERVLRTVSEEETK